MPQGSADREVAPSFGQLLSFDKLFAMKARRAIVTLAATWLKLRYASFLYTEGDPKVEEDLVEFMVDVLDVHGLHGLFVRSPHPEEVGGKGSEVFIPWKYVEGILWPDNLRQIEQRVGLVEVKPKI